MAPKKAWRSTCAKCDKAAFMLCITCESVEIQRVLPIRLKVRRKPYPRAHKEKRHEKA